MAVTLLGWQTIPVPIWTAQQHISSTTARANTVRQRMPREYDQFRLSPFTLHTTYNIGNPQTVAILQSRPYRNAKQNFAVRFATDRRDIYCTGREVISDTFIDGMGFRANAMRLNVPVLVSFDSFECSWANFLIAQNTRINQGNNPFSAAMFIAWLDHNTWRSHCNVLYVQMGNVNLGQNPVEVEKLFVYEPNQVYKPELRYQIAKYAYRIGTSRWHQIFGDLHTSQCALHCMGFIRKVLGAPNVGDGITPRLAHAGTTYF